MIRLLVVSSNKSFSKELDAVLSKYIAPDTQVIYCDVSDAEAPASKLEPYAVFMDLTSMPESVLSLPTKLHALNQFPCFIGVGPPKDVSLVMMLVKAGFKDFLNIPLNTDEVKEIVDQLKPSSHSGSPGVPSSEKNAKVVTCFSPKGGVGVTLITANLSIALAKHHNKKVIVCDLAPQCGDISTYLNLIPRYTIRDVIDNNQHLDYSFLEACLLPHPSGVKILATPNEFQDVLTRDNLNSLKSILFLLKKAFDIILIDGSHLDSVLLQYVMSDSDLIFLVGNPDVACLKGLISSFNRLKSLPYSTDKVKVLINRSPSKNQIDPNKFEKATKHSISYYLPNNFMLCIEAVNTGQTLMDIHEKSDLSKKIIELADLIVKDS